MLLWSPSRAPFKNVFEKCFSKMFFKNVHFSLWGKNSATSTIIALILRILENCVLIHRLFYMYTSSTNFFFKSLPYFSFLGGLALLGLCSSSNKSAMFQLFPLRFRGQTIFKRISNIHEAKHFGAAINCLHILSRCRIHSSSLTAFSI